MGSMMALRAHTQSGPEVLVYEPAPRPVPGPGEVLVSVHAAAITFDELSWPETWSVGGVDRTPVIPSHEFSGVVAATFPLAGVGPLARAAPSGDFALVRRCWSCGSEAMSIR